MDRQRDEAQDSHLSAEQLQELRDQLEAELKRLERSMCVTDLGLRPVELDQTAVGRLSRMDEMQNQAMTRNLREREDLKLARLQQALSRIGQGTYGRCTECGAEIPVPRLQVFPETATCVECTA